MTDPAPSGAIATYVREGSVKVPIWSTERNFFYCLVNYEVLEKGKQKGTENLRGYSSFSGETQNIHFIKQTSLYLRHRAYGTARSEASGMNTQNVTQDDFKCAAS